MNAQPSEAAATGAHVAPAPIFVACCSRSGSTLLRYILDAHPQIACPPELHLGALCERLVWSNALALGHRVPDAGLPATDYTPPAPVLEAANRAVHGLMRSCLDRTGKSLWCDKSVTTTDHLSLLRRVFPDARFLMLHRNCMDVVHSALEVSRFGYSGYGFLSYLLKSPENTVAAIVDYWCDKTERALDFEAQFADGCLRIRYEDLVFDPAATVPDVLAFAGARRDDGLLDRIFTTPHEPGPGDANILFAREISQGSVGKGSSIPLAQIPEPRRSRMNALLGRLGYPPVGADWDRQANPYSRGKARRPGGAGEGGERPEEAASRAARMFASAREQGTVKFVFEDCDDQAWRIVLGRPGAEPVDTDADADCEVRITVPTLVAVAEGTAQPMELWRSGQLRIAGNADLIRLAIAG